MFSGVDSAAAQYTTINAHNGLVAMAVPGFLTDLTVSGDVQLEGPVYGARLTGRGTATQGVLWFADLSCVSSHSKRHDQMQAIHR